MKRWWMKELSDLKRVKNKLSKISYCFRGTPDHPSHAEHKSAARNLSNCVDITKKKHWVKWLKDAKFKDIYTANRYSGSKNCPNVWPFFKYLFITQC